MGVSYFTCKACNNAFPDCGDYTFCENCGSDWCSDECAEGDGYENSKCKLGKDVSSDGYCEDECELLEEDSDWCGDCKYYIKASCNYCNGNDMTDEEVVKKLIDKYKLKTRIELVEFLFGGDKNEKK